MTDISDAALLRSQLFAELIARRADAAQRKIVEDYTGFLDYDPIKMLMISPDAWDHVSAMGVAPQLVFAHPDILQAHPRTSAYYRGIALLPRKRVYREAKADVKKWETGERKSPVGRAQAKKVARFYNITISSIIEGKTDWALENGYRNILATMGITLDGSHRNDIGKNAEHLVRSRVVSWLQSRQVIPPGEPDDGLYRLPENIIMRFGSEPDISFEHLGNLIATIEVKGGTDPAGALERLGAMKKSFDETPAGCQNFLVSGVITASMRARIKDIGTVKVYLLGDLTDDKDKWEDFAREVFHHALRVS